MCTSRCVYVRFFYFYFLFVLIPFAIFVPCSLVSLRFFGSERSYRSVYDAQGDSFGPQSGVFSLSTSLFKACAELESKCFQLLACFCTTSLFRPEGDIQQNRSSTRPDFPFFRRWNVSQLLLGSSLLSTSSPLPQALARGLNQSLTFQPRVVPTSYLSGAAPLASYMAGNNRGNNPFFSSTNALPPASVSVHVDSLYHFHARCCVVQQELSEVISGLLFDLPKVLASAVSKELIAGDAVSAYSTDLAKKALIPIISAFLEEKRGSFDRRS